MNYLISKTKHSATLHPAAKSVSGLGLFEQPLIIQINRFSLFVVFFWFGILKVLSLSPAETLVKHLHQVTLGGLISEEHFLIILGLIECTIGILWLCSKWTRFAFLLFTIQMFTTFLPMILLPRDTWQNTMVLTLTGQYIIKNLVLIASALTIFQYYNEINISQSNTKN
jgi:uncharacterized membrane protein YkgB